MKRKIKPKVKLIQVIVILFLIICIAFYLYKLNKNSYSIKENSYTVNNKYIYNILNQDKKDEIKSEKIQKLEQLQKLNSDIVALLEIEGTNINYPVLQSGDNSYYLTHNYKKEKSKDGALMLDKNSDILKPTTNILIYGHNNIGSKEMFADLIKYKNKYFYEQHKTIKFITNTEEQVYEIICVIQSKVYYKTQTNVFKYYFFIDAKSKEEFDSFITNCKKLSLYDIASTAVYGDLLMTLSTCEYSRQNGRFAVIAKKVK